MGPDVAKKRGNPSKNYSPPIPPTRIPFLLIPDLFYVRFLEFSVFHFVPREPGLESPADWGPTKCKTKQKNGKRKEAILSKNDDFGKLSKFLEKQKSFFWKLIGYTRRFMLVKHENRLPPCHVRPNPAKLRGNRFAWSMPCPRTPPDLPYSL